MRTPPNTGSSGVGPTKVSTINNYKGRPAEPRYWALIFGLRESNYVSGAIIS